MKDAMINTPYAILDSSSLSESISVVTYEMSRRLAKHCDVIVYSVKGSSQKEFEYCEGVNYRRIAMKRVEERASELHGYVASMLYRVYNKSYRFITPPFASKLHSFM